jgi:succinate dehydrogenase / fumarate reductase cytochrome b subunit
MGNAGIAVTGLVLVLFLVAHLGGVALALLDGPAFENYASALHRQPWLPLLELALAAVALAHPALSLRRAVANARARGAVSGSMGSRRASAGEGWAVLAARVLPWSGGLLLLFLAVHLAQLRWDRPVAGGERAALLAVLTVPGWLALYVAAGVAVALHLFHGHESAHRSLGLLEKANAGRIRTAGRALALVLGGGFALLPLGLVLRWGLPGGVS